MGIVACVKRSTRMQRIALSTCRLPPACHSPLKEHFMNKLIAAICIALPLYATGALAADTSPPSQQSKMAACSAANKGLKGEEFKKAQKECLSKDATPVAATPAPATAAAAPTATPVTQQSKMAACSKANKGLKGDEFKNAQKECLSK
jgi:hypothetical protein